MSKSMNAVNMVMANEMLSMLVMMMAVLLFLLLSLSLLAFYVTRNDISVIYCDGTDVQEALRRSCTYGRAPNAIDISQGSLTCPSYTDTGPTFLYYVSDTPPPPFSRLLRHAARGYGESILELTPRCPHGCFCC